jgi:glycosyltransferase involved in cell wall biosynthesis/putative flippase GtrA
VQIIGRELPQFGRFLIVGAAAVGLNMILYLLLVGLLRIPYLLATAVIFFAGKAFGFVANRTWTFSRTDRPLHRLAIYYATMLASLAANLLSMLVLVDGLGVHYLIASAITSLWLAPVLYLAHQLLAFRMDEPRSTTDVTMLTNYFPEHGGGVEAVALQLVSRLAPRIDIRWLADGQPAAMGCDGTRQMTISGWNGLERRFGLPIPLPTLGGLRLVVRSVRDAPVVWVHDLIYVSNMAAAITALALRKPLVVTVHVGSIPYRSRAARLIMRAALSVAGLLMTRADSVVFVSERVRTEFSARWRLREAELIPNGVDSSIFKPLSDDERRATRARLGVGDQPLALFVGRFVERKGLHLLADLARESAAIQWVFAGDGPIDPEGWGLANVHVYRRCTANIVAEFCGAADLVVLPSVGEGFPLVVQEALATGARVLVDPSTAAGFPGVDASVETEPVVGPNATLARSN